MLLCKMSSDVLILLQEPLEDLKGVVKDNLGVEGKLRLCVDLLQVQQDASEGLYLKLRRMDRCLQANAGSFDISDQQALENFRGHKLPFFTSCDFVQPVTEEQGLGSIKFQAEELFS